MIDIFFVMYLNSILNYVDINFGFKFYFFNIYLLFYLNIVNGKT